jgi:uncharacterized protein (TIGR03067 family)
MAFLLAAAEPKVGAGLLQGTWQVVSAHYDGKPKEASKQTAFVFAGNRLTIKESDRSEEAVIKVNPDPKPSTIDFLSSEGKEETARGIYQLDGDTLKLCWSLPGKDRPTAFESRPDNGQTLVILKRAKP